MNKLITLAVAGTMLAAGAPAFAQMQNGNMSSSSTMSSDKKMKMSDADMKKWQSCQAMSNDMMMKDKKCMSLKKKNDMMNK